MFYTGKPADWPNGLYIHDDEKEHYDWVLVVCDGIASWLHKETQQIFQPHFIGKLADHSFSMNFVKVSEL